MIAINMEYFEINREYISSKKFIVKSGKIVLGVVVLNAILLPTLGLFIF